MKDRCLSKCLAVVTSKPLKYFETIYNQKPNEWFKEMEKLLLPLWIRPKKSKNTNSKWYSIIVWYRDVLSEYEHAILAYRKRIIYDDLKDTAWRSLYKRTYVINLLKANRKKYTKRNIA